MMLEAIKKAAANHLPLSPGERIGCGALILAVLLGVVNLRLAAIPLALFVFLCMAAPFIPSSRFFVPVISRGRSDQTAVALTFDDGPDPLTTPALLALLEQHRVAATFFVSGQRAMSYPHLIREISARGHSIGNHSLRHDLLGAFKSAAAMRCEIEATQRALEAVGIQALAYRPPMGITSPQLRQVMKATGMFVVNFSCRGRDGGNRRVRNLSARILRRVRANDILLLHDLAPRPASLLGYWIGEVNRIIIGVEAQGLKIVPLADLIGRPVMAHSRENDDRRRNGPI